MSDGGNEAEWMARIKARAELHAKAEDAFFSEFEKSMTALRDGDGSMKIRDAVRQHIAASMNNTIESSIMGAMTSTTEPVAQQEPLTAKAIAISMARAVFDAEIIISEYVPKETTDENGATTPVDAFRIDNTQLPDWDMRCAIAKAKGQPPPHPVTIVFPSPEKAFEAVSALRPAEKEKGE